MQVFKKQHIREIVVRRWIKTKKKIISVYTRSTADFWPINFPMQVVCQSILGGLKNAHIPFHCLFHPLFLGKKQKANYANPWIYCISWHRYWCHCLHLSTSSVASSGGHRWNLYIFLWRDLEGVASHCNEFTSLYSRVLVCFLALYKIHRYDRISLLQLCLGMYKRPFCGPPWKNHSMNWRELL